MASEHTHAEYAFDYGDEIEDWRLKGGVRDDAEALRRSAELAAPHADRDPALYAHKLMTRTVTVIEGPWEEVT